jgi:hypothetical protein
MLLLAHYLKDITDIVKKYDKCQKFSQVLCQPSAKLTIIAS